jgi:hypothetical protein
LAFSANGRRLASGSWDNTVLIWDLIAPLNSAKLLIKEPGDKEIATWWEDLASEDARRAHAAIWALADAPAASVPFLKKRLKPATEDQAKEISRHIADLDNNTFEVREKASEQLKKLGLAAAPALQKLLEKDISAEVRRRVEQLLSELSNKPILGESLRTIRALSVLEHAGTAESLRLIEGLGKGASEAWLTNEAKAVQRRIKG